MRAFFTKEFSTKRLVRTGNKQSWSTHVTGLGHFKPLNEEASALNDVQFGKGFELITEEEFDIGVTDKVIIDTVTYEVNGVTPYNFGGVSFKKAILSLGLE